MEEVTWQGRPLMYIIRAGPPPAQTTFPTPPELNLQVGFVVTPAGGTIQPHVHLPVVRRLVGSAEVLLVQQGRCDVDVYSEDRQHVATCRLAAGDIMIMVGGGHGFRMLEDTVLLEVKQGPYPGVAEKERF